LELSGEFLKPLSKRRFLKLSFESSVFLSDAALSKLLSLIFSPTFSETEGASPFDSARLIISLGFDPSAVALSWADAPMLINKTNPTKKRIDEHYISAQQVPCFLSKRKDGLDIIKALFDD